MNTNDTPKTDLPALTHEQQKAVLDTKKVLADKEQALKDLGQIEAFQFLNKLTNVATLKLIQNIKETKSYKGLTYIKENGEIGTIANFDEFCEFKLSRPKRTVDDELLNLKTFGEEFFEASKKVGLTSNHLRKLRALPDDERLLVMQNEALESGDKDAILEVIDELHYKHKHDTQSIKNELSDAKADLAATRQLNSEQAKREEELMVKLEKAKYAPENWQQKVIDTIQEIIVKGGQGAIAHDQLNQIRMLIDHESCNGENSQEAMEYITSVYFNTVEQLAQRYALLLADAVESLPWQHPRKTTEAVLLELADKGAEEILSTDE